MKPKKKTTRTIVIVVLSLAVVTAGVLYGIQFFGKSAATSSDTSHQIGNLSVGTLQQTAKGSGSLSVEKSETLTAPADSAILTVEVTDGQSVKAGDLLATIDTSAMHATLSALQSELDTMDSRLAQLAESASTTDTLKSPAAGRVKQILANVNDDVSADEAQQNGLLTLSTNGLMRLEIALSSAGAAAPGDTVKVTAGDTTYEGTVRSVATDGLCVITLTDNGPELGDEASVTTSDSATQLGNGTLAIDQPLLVTAPAGVISKIHASENANVARGTSLFYLVNIPASQDYQSQAKARAEKAQELADARILAQTGEICAEQDGIIQSITAKSGDNVKSGDPLMTMLVGGATQLNISIDELDINKIEVGQNATVSLDAFADKTFEGTVTALSNVASPSNGVTNYIVSITLENPDGETLRVGMNSTATVTVEEHKDVLLLPIEALQYSQGESFVWLYTGSIPTDSTQNPGEQVFVETGLSNANFVEITDGLSLDDKVVIVRTRTSNNTANFGGGNAITGMPIGGSGPQFITSGGGPRNGFSR